MFCHRLATWKRLLLGGEQTHDGLDDCHDLKEVIAKVAENENMDMAGVIQAGDQGRK